MKQNTAAKYILLAILITISLASACTTATPVLVVPSATVPLPTTSATSEPTAAATLTAQPSPLPPTVTATPKPTDTIEPTRPPNTPTPNGEVTWAAGIDVHPIDEIFDDGAWSPTKDEIVYFVSKDHSYFLSDKNNANDIVLMHFAAPDFQPQEIRATSPTPPDVASDCVYPGLLWSRDGKRIFFSGPGVNLPERYMEPCSIWMVEHDGRNPRLYEPEQYGRSLSPDGWLDDRTLLLTGYREGIRLFDLITGKTINGAYPRYFGESLFTRNYFVGTHGDSGFTQIYALGRRDQPIDWPIVLVGEENGMKFALTPPPDNIYHAPGHTIVYDALPNTNKVLADWSWDTVNTTDPNSVEIIFVHKLVLWDIDQNTLTTLVPYGLWGHFSPDKRTLAYLTGGPAPLDAKNKPVDPYRLNPKDPYGDIANMGSYLQLMDLSTGSVFLSVPIASRGDFTYTDFPYVGVNFSPNGQFLSFTTGREIVFDDKGWPEMNQPDSPAEIGRHLYVLDLKNRRLVWEQSDVAAILYGFHYPSSLDNYLANWSPKSNQFTYLDAENNPVLVNLSTGAQTPITLKVSGMPSIKWSASGEYIAVQIPVGYSSKIGFVKIP